MCRGPHVHAVCIYTYVDIIYYFGKEKMAHPLVGFFGKEPQRVVFLPKLT